MGRYFISNMTQISLYQLLDEHEKKVNAEIKQQYATIVTEFNENLKFLTKAIDVSFKEIRVFIKEDVESMKNIVTTVVSPSDSVPEFEDSGSENDSLDIKQEIVIASENLIPAHDTESDPKHDNSDSA